MTGYNARDELGRYFEGLARDWEMIEYKVDQFVAQGDRVVMLGRLRVAQQAHRQGRSTRRRWIPGASRTARRSNSTSTSTPRRCMPPSPEATRPKECDRDRPQQPPRRAEPDRHRQDRAQGAFPRRGDADDAGDHRHAGLDPRAGALAGRPHRLRHGLWRRRVRQARQPRPPHRGDRPAVEVADARHRSRRGLCAARRDDGRAGHALVVGRARQCGAGDRSRERQGRRRSTSATPRTGSRSATRPARSSRR